MSEYFQQLKGFNSVFDSTLNNEILDSIVEYFDWALLEKGNYFNTTSGELAPNGLDYSELRASSNDHYSSGQVWEGFRKNWVWQSGISYDAAPLVGLNDANPGVSGVYVNGQFKPNTITGTYEHYIDHFNGKVVFNSPIPTGSTVQVEHSYKWINVCYANNLPWIREIQKNTLQPDSTFKNLSDGQWDVPPELRLQLPTIAVEIVPSRTFKGYQLGGGQFVYTDVIFHCLAESEIVRNKLIDIVSLQNDKSIYIFNSNAISANTHPASGFPLDYRGVPVSGALRYPDLVEAYPGGKLRFSNVRVQEMMTFESNIYGGIVRITTEGVKSNI
jgi:hypothetical protein